MVVALKWDYYKCGKYHHVTTAELNLSIPCTNYNLFEVAPFMMYIQVHCSLMFLILNVDIIFLYQQRTINFFFS